jgi:hypothetical protein
MILTVLAFDIPTSPADIKSIGAGQNAPTEPAGKDWTTTCIRLLYLSVAPCVENTRADELESGVASRSYTNHNVAPGATMIKNFEEAKKQLAELSEVVNKFKSEAVQLRIVELVFAGGSGQSEETEVPHEGNGQAPRKHSRKKRKAATSSPPAKGESKKARAATGKGPKATLEKFIGEGFFNQKRTIGAVVEHCELKAQHFKNNELSGPLGRLVRDNKLTRTKNAESQYEYIKK